MSSLAGDCNDNDATIFPGADETPDDGIDQDCSGSDLTDVDGDGVDAIAASGNDCDDRRADISPNAPDVRGDGIDQHCNGSDRSCSALFAVLPTTTYQRPGGVDYADSPLDTRLLPGVGAATC